MNRLGLLGLCGGAWLLVACNVGSERPASATGETPSEMATPAGPGSCTFRDASLRRQVQSTLTALASDDPGVIDSLWIEASVKSLAGAECLTGLKSLTLEGLAAPDLAPLAELPALEELQLFNVARADFETLRSGSDLPSRTLRRLVVDGTELSQLAWLSGFETLQSLGLSRNGLQTLESLPMVPSLLTVALEGNRVELGPLAKQPSLEGITASDCSMTDVKTLNGAPLHYLSLSHCPVSTFDGLELPHLRDIYAYGVPLTAFGNLSGLPELANVEVMGSQLASLEGLEGASKLGRLLVKGSPLSDISALRELTQLEFLDVQDSPLVDVSPLSAWSELDGTCRVLTLPKTALQAEVGASTLDALCAAHFVIDDRCGEHCFGLL